MATSPAARLAFAMLAFVQSSLIFTIALIMVPLPKIAAEFDLTATDVLTLQVAYGLPFSGLLLFGGRLADRYGGRRMFILGLILFGGASVIAAIAPTYGLLTAMRFLEGVAGAMIAPAAMSLLHRLFPDPKDFGQAMATWGGVSVLGAILGFVLSGIVTTWISWRWMFAVPILVALVALISTSVLLPRHGDENLAARPRLDPLGALLATAGIVLGSYGLIMTGDHPWASAPVLAPLTISAILLAVFFAVEGKMRDPMLPPAFLADPCRITGLLGMMLAAVGSIAIEYILSLYLQQVRGWSPLTTTLAFLPFAVTLIVTNHLSPALVSRFGAVQITIAGLVVAAFGLGLLAGLASDSSYLVGLMPGTLLVAIGMSLMFSGSAVLSMTNVPLRQAGLAGGVMNTAMELGPTVGLAVLMSVAATQGDVVRGYGCAFGAASLFYIILAVFAARSGRQGACAVAGG
ncbi:MFS transporter [Mesorhizobium retamae]|uniref:MFS transporter n=1 Tax=Mesorhizobium retamae TaxID=2912854 RepID=A0ABS9QCU5_9HYPH|nr:MFS transporter [Mesorhizobium sp. IRAMC:0171]MCG7505230.1 MFS transporter [Mesorhizobium sp. IRAMC:0171]